MGHEHWLPPPPQRPELSGLPPWRPQALGRALTDDELDRHAYVTVDEIIGDGVGLLLAPWPRIDDSGRLRFAPEEDQILVGAAAADFREFLDRNRIVMVVSFEGQLEDKTAAELRNRDLEIGDVFAIRRDEIESTLTTERPGHEGETVADFARLYWTVRVYDLSAEARQRAKLAMAAVLAAPLDEDTARQVLGSDPVDESAAEAEAAQPLAVTPEGVLPADALDEGLDR